MLSVQSSDMPGPRTDRRVGDPWDQDQSQDPNLIIYGEEARPLPRDGRLPTIKDINLAVEFALRTSETAYQDQYKLAVRAVVLEVENLWTDLVPEVICKETKNVIRDINDIRVNRSLYNQSRKKPGPGLDNLLRKIRVAGTQLFNISRQRYNKTEKTTTSIPKTKQRDILFLQGTSLPSA